MDRKVLYIVLAVVLAAVAVFLGFFGAEVAVHLGLSNSPSI